MASKQSEVVRELYAGWTQTRLNGEEQDNEHWGDLTRDPGGVDYIETGTDGVPAMWVIPKGGRRGPGAAVHPRRRVHRWLHLHPP